MQKYYPDAIKYLNSFWPCRLEGGAMTNKKAKTKGDLHVLAFDSQFKDNGGSYGVHLTVTRKVPDRTYEESRKRLKAIS